MSRLRVKEAAAYIPMAEGTLNNLRVSGGGPRFIKIGKRILYDQRDLDKWIEDHKRNSTADIPAHRLRKARRNGQMHATPRIRTTTDCQK
jgi:predicted DNA-binding transcriptional regulator AlpA